LLFARTRPPPAHWLPFCRFFLTGTPQRAFRTDPVSLPFWLAYHFFSPLSNGSLPQEPAFPERDFPSYRRLGPTLALIYRGTTKPRLRFPPPDPIVVFSKWPDSPTRGEHQPPKSAGNHLTPPPPESPPHYLSIEARGSPRTKPIRFTMVTRESDFYLSRFLPPASRDFRQDMLSYSKFDFYNFLRLGKTAEELYILFLNCARCWEYLEPSRNSSFF